MASSAKLNPLMLSILVILIMITVLCTGLVWHKSNAVKRLQEGEPEKPAEKFIGKVDTEINELRNKIKDHQEAIAVRERERYRLDNELANFRTYYSANGNLLLAGITGEEVQRDGQAFRIKQSTLRLTRELIAQSVARMDGLRQEHESPDRQSFPRLEEAITKRQNQMQAVLTHNNELDAAFNADRERLTAQLDELNKEKEKIERQRREDDSRRRTKNGQLEDHIRELLELELRWVKEIEPDGQVLELGSEHGFVVINIGRVDRVFPGLILEDFQYDHGKYLEKGMLEVTEVRSQIATCRVVKENDARKNPIAKGDSVGNPVFDVRKPKVFVLAGEFEHYNKEDLETFIKKTGGLVRDKLSPGVDFLVAGLRSDKQKDAAREYQVQAMTENQLLKYVQTTFAPK